MSEPRFELGISDSIANHITTRPRSIYWNRGKNFEKSSISNMIYLYGLIQPMGGRNRVNRGVSVYHSRNSTTKLTKEIAITSWVWPSKLAIIWPVLMSHCIQVWSPLLVIIWLSFRNRQQLTNPSWPVSFWLKNK